MNRETQAVESLASLIRVVSNALNMSQSALIDAVAKRLITSPLFSESVIEKFANDLATEFPHHAKRCDNEQCGICLDTSKPAEGWRRPHTCIKHNVVYADGEQCGICLDTSKPAGVIRTTEQRYGIPPRAPNQDLIATPPAPIPVSGTCRMCGCTDADCSDCIRLTAVACTWIEPDLCSACVDLMKEI